MNKSEPNKTTATKRTPKNSEVLKINQVSDTPLNELLLDDDDDDDASSASSDIFLPVQTKATAAAHASSSRAGSKQRPTKDTDLGGPASSQYRVSRLIDLLDDDDDNYSSASSANFVPVPKEWSTTAPL